jgi:TolB-like protein/Tfp pilus assembly protein PilF
MVWYRFGEFELRPDRYELRRSGELLPAEPRVLEVLAYLIDHRERVVSRSELLKALWPQQFISDAALTRAVRGVRRLLGERASSSRWVQTVYGRGVRWKGEATIVEDTKPAAGAIVSIAVLPFENQSGDATQEFFADGMTDALINELARLDSVNVISRTSVMRYKGTREPLPEIGRKLAVSHLVEGSVTRAGDRVRVQARLLRASTDQHLWAARYDRELRDVLALQSQLAESIVGEINVKLNPDEKTRLSRPRPRVDPEVYTLDLVGRFVLNRRTEEAFRHALRCFEQALARDPEYAPAWVGVADCYNMLGNYGVLPPGKVHEPARAATRKALDLDPLSAEAHRSLAQMKWNFEFDWAGAEQEYRTAAGLNPQSSLVRWWYGVFLGVQGRFEEALDQLRRGRELDPLAVNITTIMGWIHYFARRYEESLPYYQEVLEIDPFNLMAHWMLGEAQIEIGRYDAGIASLEHALFLSPRSSRLSGYLGYAYGRAGRRGEAEETIRNLERRRTTGYVPAYFTALVHSGLGQTSDALDWLERAWNERDTMLRDLKIDPPWASLQGEARYGALLANVGLRETLV